MGKIKILICDPLHDEGLKLLQKEGFQVDFRPGLSEDSLVKIIPDYDAVVVRSSTKITSKVVEAGKQLKLIGRAGIGVDNIEVSSATRRGILVMNTPEANSITTAELAISMLLAISRKLAPANESVRKGLWEKSKFVGREITGKTLGIVGFGRIGRAVAERGLGLKMKVLAYDPFLPSEKTPIPGVNLVDFETLLKDSDFITLHTPLNESTRHLFRKETFQKMKAGAVLINCARGGIVNEKDLVHALKEGTLGGAALDVFEKEPPEKSSLWELDNVLCTPHVGASTDEAQYKVSIEIAEQIRDYFKTGSIRNTVNAPSLSPEISDLLKPFVVLGEKLGAFLAQTLDEPIRKIEITCRGEIHKMELSPVRAAVLAGVLSPSLDASVNMVNAPYLAAERGIKVLEAKEPESRDFLNVISVRVYTQSQKSKRAAGTVFGKRPRLVQIDDFYLDALPEGNLLVTRHLDRPGVIGKIGTLMGSSKVNISRLQLGSTEAGDETAIGILNIDSPLSAELLREIQNIPNILEARYVRL